MPLAVSRPLLMVIPGLPILSTPSGKCRIGRGNANSKATGAVDGDHGARVTGFWTNGNNKRHPGMRSTPRPRQRVGGE
jgi:hypothetical protein